MTDPALIDLSKDAASRAAEIYAEPPSDDDDD